MLAVDASCPLSCIHHWENALLQECAKSTENGVPAGSDSPWSLLYVTPCTVYVAGQVTGLFSEASPSLISAVEVMIFMVEPGATLAVRAKSLNWALLASARM